MNKEDIKKIIRKQLRYYRGRVRLLEKYRNMDLDKEILDCLNEIKKLKRRLEDMK